MIASLPALTIPPRTVCGYPFLAAGLDWAAIKVKADEAGAVLVAIDGGAAYAVQDAATYGTLRGACNFYLVPRCVAGVAK